MRKYIYAMWLFTKTQFKIVGRGNCPDPALTMLAMIILLPVWPFIAWSEVRKMRKGKDLPNFGHGPYTLDEIIEIYK